METICIHTNVKHKLVFTAQAVCRAAGGGHDAAGNHGTATTSYPAGYASVMSVAAVDDNKAFASFSQYNSDVEIAGPGVSVLSTVPMGAGIDTALSVGASNYASSAMDGSPVKTATKVQNCQSSGGVGAVVYNNVAGGFGGTLNGMATTIPSLTASYTDGTAMKTRLGSSATVAVKAANYADFDGTSMATLHVSAVAAWCGATSRAAPAPRSAPRWTTARSTLAPPAATRTTATAWCRPRLPTSGSSRWAAVNKSRQFHGMAKGRGKRPFSLRRHL